MSGRRRAALLTGRALSVAGVVATLSVALIRYTGIQELGFRMMGIAAVSVALTGLAGLVAMAGVLLQLVARRRPTRWTWWSLAGAALPVLLVLEMTAPALAGAVAPERATTGTPFGVVVQNLYYQHEDPGRSLAAVLERRADVLVLIEFTPEAERILDDRWGDEVRARYPHQWRDARGFGAGLAVLSALPMEEVVRVPLTEPAVRVRLSVGGVEVDLYAVHPVAPSDRWGLLSWQHDYRVLVDDARDASPHTIMAGDFNASTGHRAFRRLLRVGRLRDAQDAGGGGVAGTWPSGWLVPPLMRLDHVLVGRGIGVEGVELLPHSGSDHRGVEARLRVPRS